MAEPISIRKIIDKVSAGEIRIPAFQRGFIWTPTQVAFLMDSLYKGFPVGSIFLWKTNEKLNTEKDLGGFSLPEPTKQHPIYYVLDGQQRITSLFSVFQTELSTGVNEEWLDIYFDFDAEDSIQESRFVALKESEVCAKHFPLNTMFDSVKYRKATEHLKDDQKEFIDKVQETFKEILLPVQEIETEDKGIIAIVFERINRAGTELDTYQLLSAWSWSTDFDLQEEFTQLAEELEPFGFGNISADKDLQLKCCSGVINGEASPQSIMSLRGEDVRGKFERIKNGIKGSIDFLKKELNVHSLKALPYPSMIVALTRFFASDNVNGRLYTDNQRKQLVKWFWKSNFSRRYTSGVTDKHKKDIIGMDELIKNENYNLSDFECIIDENFYLRNKFSLNSINSKTFILQLANNNPKSFISGANVNLDKVLKNVSKNEFHHIFPKKFLERKSFASSEIDLLANICFLNNSDNQTIKDKDPKVYKSLITSDSYQAIMDSNFIPRDGLELDYETFTKERVKILLKNVQLLIN